MSELANTRYADAKPELSILIPFLRDDPRPLLERLLREADIQNSIEIILLDDGTGSQQLTRDLGDLIVSADTPVKLLTLTQNIGRAKGRNRLADLARSSYLLFLDADMLPDSDSFIGQWIAFIQEYNPAAAFGGFSLDQAPTEKRFAVHRAMALKSDCLSAEQRSQQPEKHLFTSNLLIRQDIYSDYRFDSSFSGWGWEDVEWAMRISREHQIMHPDIPATHTGLDTVTDLKRKYRQSAANFASLAEMHPDLVSRYPSYRAAMLFKRTGLAALVRMTSGAAASIELLPAALRALSLRFYRAALYARALAVATS